MWPFLRALFLICLKTSKYSFLEIAFLITYKKVSLQCEWIILNYEKLTYVRISGFITIEVLVSMYYRACLLEILINF